MVPVAMGIDVGGTKIAGGIVDPEGRILHSLTVATPSHFAELELALCRLVECLLVAAEEETGSAPLDIVGIGVAVPGEVDRRQGVAIGACNLPWKDFGMKRLLENRYGIPTQIENDADAAAVGVYRYAPEARGIESFVLMTIGTGIGGGIILNGKLHGDGWPMAGEVGHMIVLPDGPQCNCGAKGCLETLASGTAIGRRGQAKAQLEQRGALWSAFQEKGEITGADVVINADKGDALSQEVLREAARFLAIGILNVNWLISPEAIIVAGGVVKESDILVRYTDEALARLHPTARPCMIQVRGGSVSGVKGAAASVWQNVQRSILSESAGYMSI